MIGIPRYTMVYLILLFSICHVSALGYDNPNLPKIEGTTPTQTSTSFNNNTGNVNNSQYLQGYVPADFASKIWGYNMTQPFTNWLSSFLYNYNQTSSGSYNASYVPYTGATSNVNLGVKNITAGKGTFGNAIIQSNAFFSTELGYSPSATGGKTQPIAIGDANANNDYAIAIGSGTTAAGVQSIAIGKATSTGALAQFGTAVGAGASAAGLQSTAIGYTSSASGQQSAALGAQSTAGHSGGLALGLNAITTTDYQVALANGVDDQILWDGGIFKLGTNTLTSAGLEVGGVVYTIDDVTGLVASQDAAGSSFTADGYYFEFQVYAYLTAADLTRVVSASYAYTDFTDDSSTDPYDIYLEWDAVVDAEGYYIVMTDPVNGYTFDRYIDTGSTDNFYTYTGSSDDALPFLGETTPYTIDPILQVNTGADSYFDGNIYFHNSYGTSNFQTLAYFNANPALFAQGDIYSNSADGGDIIFERGGLIRGYVGIDNGGELINFGLANSLVLLDSTAVQISNGGTQQAVNSFNVINNRYLFGRSNTQAGAFVQLGEHKFTNTNIAKSNVSALMISPVYSADSDKKVNITLQQNIIINEPTQLSQANNYNFTILNSSVLTLFNPNGKLPTTMELGSNKTMFDNPDMWMKIDVNNTLKYIPVFNDMAIKNIANINITGKYTSQNASSYSGQVVCYATGGTLGHCTSVVGVTGGCTCVAN